MLVLVWIAGYSVYRTGGRGATELSRHKIINYKYKEANTWIALSEECIKHMSKMAWKQHFRRAVLFEWLGELKSHPANSSLNWKLPLFCFPCRHFKIPLYSMKRIAIFFGVHWVVRIKGKCLHPPLYTWVSAGCIMTAAITPLGKLL